MKVKDLLKEDIDIDVCDDYDESCYIAFCGPLKLTAAGEKRFKSALERDVKLHIDIAILHAEDDREVNELKELFWSAAGYCADRDYQKWFDEEE